MTHTAELRVPEFPFSSGNRTTVLEIISGTQKALESPKAALSENVAELLNLKKAVDFIDSRVTFPAAM